MGEEKKSVAVEAGIVVGTELLVSLIRLVFAEYRRQGMTPDEMKAALLAELAVFDASDPNKIPDV